MSTDLTRLDAAALSDGIRNKTYSAVEVITAHLDYAERANRSLNAFLHVDREGALAQATAVDRKVAKGEALGPLAGVPVAIKDNLCVRGLPTTCASKILEGYRPPYDAHVIQCLREADAVMIAKANMDEFAMGSSNENSAFGPCKNPWELSRAPGGSSGGSAAAVSSGMAALALGSDTGGSVRQPAAFCGITAIKPTYGRVSRYGLIAFASSLDQVGTMSRTVKDGATLFEVIAQPDVRDATCTTRSTDAFSAVTNKSTKGLRVGIVRSAMKQGTETDVVNAVEATAKKLAAQGHQVVDIDLPHAQYAVAVYYLVATAEASSNLARFDGMRYGLRVEGDNLLSTYQRSRAEGFGAEVKRRIMLGTYALSAGYYDAFYVKAQKVRALIQRDFAQAFEKCDVVVTPTAPTAAFKIGEKSQDPLAMYMADIFTLPASLAGLPAVSLPCGLNSAGLPLSVQLTGRAFAEADLLALAQTIERDSGVVQALPRTVV